LDFSYFPGDNNWIYIGKRLCLVKAKDGE